MARTLSTTEYDIMCYFWSVTDEGEKGFKDIMDHFRNVHNKTWSKQALNIFLLRLIDKGMIQARKVGNKKYYLAKMTMSDYEKLCAEEALKKNFNGKLSQFLADLTGEEKLSKADEQDLLDYIKKK